MPQSLSPNDWQRLEPLLDAVLDAAPDRRAALLAELSGGDPNQRSVLERLVAECERERRLLEHPAAERFSGLLTEEMPGFPDVIGDRYRITRQLGQGGMATVYLAHDLKHGRDVAVKVLHTAVAAIVGADRFEREIRLAAQLTHPHILPLFDSGELVVERDVGRRLWYAMPYIAGESLRTRLVRERQLPVAEAVRIAVEVADALDYAHRQGFIHRDIKPENILLHDGHALVADFGIARAINPDDGSEVTEAGILLGTPTYMSPEQASGSRALGAPTDVYSLGCVLYEMVTGRPPYSGASAVEIVAQIVSSEPPRPSLTRPDAAPLDSVIARAMARLPADRFTSARQFADALAALLSVETSGPRLASAAEAGETRPTTTSATPVERTRSRWVRHAPWFGVAAIALGALVMFRPDAAPRPQIPRIAVLPLKDMSPDRRDEPLAEELTEELISTLGRQPDKLRAISSTSVFRFRGRQIDVRLIAESLGVDNVLEGNLQRIGDRVRLSLRLVDARDRSLRWTQTYERAYPDLFAEQTNVARSVARVLGVPVTSPAADGVLSSRAQRPGAMSAGFVAAHDLYAQGSQDILLRTDNGRQQARDLFTRAIAADSTFAPAHARLAVMSLEPGAHGGRLGLQRIAFAEQHARTAFALDSTVPEAHVALGRVLMLNYRFAEAEEHYKRAIELDPTQAVFREFLVWLYVLMERRGDALDVAKGGLELESSSPSMIAEMARALLVNGRRDEARAHLDQLSHLRPPPARVGSLRAQYYALGREWQKAIDVMRPVAEDNQRAAAWLGFMLARAGQTEEANRIREQMFERWRLGAGAFELAVVYAGLGDFDNAFQWLDSAVVDRSLRPDIMEPAFAELREDPRFASIRTKLGISKRD